MAGNNFNGRSMGHDVSDQPRLSNGQFTFKGSATAATMPSHRQQAVLKAPMPVSQNAPLEERMHPASVADVVKKHAQGDHSTLQQYSPDPDAAVPYYRMGVRELGLSSFGKSNYGKRVLEMDLHYDHMHFVGSEGSNFGLTLGGVSLNHCKTLTTIKSRPPSIARSILTGRKLILITHGKNGKYWSDSARNIIPLSTR